MLEGITMLAGVLLVLIFIRVVFSNPKELKRGWKIKNHGEGKLQYSELDQNKTWRTLMFEIDRYSSGVPRHTLIVDSNWETYPNWAKSRREEILNRIKSVLKEPEYTIIEK